MVLISYLATALVLLGVYYIAKPKILGQYLMLGANISWVIYSAYTNQHALLVQSVVLTGLTYQAIRNWTKLKVGL